MEDYKNVVAEKTTITRDTIQIEEKTGNIYESIVAETKRSNQISAGEIKEELTSKLQEFAKAQQIIWKRFLENREAKSKSQNTMKGLPKPTAIATQELLDDKIYLRDPEEASE